MKTAVLFAILFLFAASAHAQNLVARDDAGTTVTLTQEACHGGPWLENSWKAASLLYHGRVIAACWKDVGRSVLILDAEGDVQPISKQEFHMETGI